MGRLLQDMWMWIDGIDCVRGNAVAIITMSSWKAVGGIVARESDGKAVRIYAENAGKAGARDGDTEGESAMGY
jgi:hypothetical protein